MKTFPEFGGKKAMVIDDDIENLRSIGRLLSNLGLEAELFSVPGELFAELEESNADVIITDMKMPEMDGIDIIRRVTDILPSVPVIVLTAFGTIDNAVLAIKEGASDYLQKPIDIEGLKGVLLKALRTGEMLDELGELRSLIKTSVGEMLYRSRDMEKVMEMVRTVAPTKANVLVLGESGTGKELVARAIHELSPRKDRLFMPINCAALTESILESELFGHEKGAYTGAVTSSKGKFETAAGGTLFLDEIGDLPLSIQAKLLRAIEQKEIMRVGGTKLIHVDVRIVAATNSYLKGRVESREFREDLFYRLSVFTIVVPPLRERKEDIHPLVTHFSRKFSEENDLQEKRVSQEVMNIFKSYSWPGNVRELKNVMESMVLLTDGNLITEKVVPREITEGIGAEKGKEPIPVSGRIKPPNGTGDVMPLDEMEKHAILEALRVTGNNKTRAAKKLGIAVRTLYRKLKEYDISQ